MQPLQEIGKLLDEARAIAVKYHALTGKPLGITGEVGEYEAARILELELKQAREPGFDAVGPDGRTFQIKTRAIKKGRNVASQRTGLIDISKQWDAVLLVLLDDELQPTEIYEASREKISGVVKPKGTGAKTRTEGGALTVSKFRQLAGGTCIWKRPCELPK